MAVDIAQLLAFAVKNNASDLHLSAGVPPMIRVDGDIKRINMPALVHKEVHSMVYDIMNDKQRKAFEEFFETDFSFEIRRGSGIPQYSVRHPVARRIERAQDFQRSMHASPRSRVGHRADRLGQVDHACRHGQSLQ